jgi:predicted phage tail protein
MASGDTLWNQLLNKKRIRGYGDLARLKGRLWHCMNICNAGIDEAIRAKQVDTEEVRRWIHAMNQVASTYIRAESAEYDQKKKEEVAEELGQGLSRLLDETKAAKSV